MYFAAPADPRAELHTHLVYERHPRRLARTRQLAKQNRGRVSATSLCTRCGCKHIHDTMNLFTATMNNISRDPQVLGTRGSI